MLLLYLFLLKTIENISILCSGKVIGYNPPGTIATQPAITCSKLTIKMLEQGVKYVQS